MFSAHIKQSASGQEIQTSAQHSRNSAQHASRCLADIGLKYTGFLLGLVHDCGKFKEEFEQYLTDPHGVRGSVNHTFAGTRLLLERYHTQDNGIRCLCAELLAFAVGSHHGLFDCVDENRKSGFLHRMTKPDIGYIESRQNFLEQCASEEELDSLFEQTVRELSSVCERLAGETSGEKDPAEYSFQISLLARLLLSALIEGDRRDTAEFMGAITYAELPEDMHRFWSPYLKRVEERLGRFPTDTAISRARGEISDRCRACAERPGGIYRLNVPTGGGKTLSALRYALAHAKKWGKRRIIFTSPLLSILEQNAAVIREYLGDDSIILEHHSNVLRTDDGWELDQRELAVESWNSPVIVTTLVQLLNTLFEGRTTSVRRFQGLCNSVIVIDEVQTVPPKMLTLFNLAMDFLANVCGTTILLCSATQPCLEKTDHPIRSHIWDMIPYDRCLWEPFHRTIITDAGGKTLEEIVPFVQDELEQTKSLLVVCNRKDEAEYLFLQLQNQADVCCHLSASMCTAHRRTVLAKLNRALAERKKCLCVATQVIEAGVDISFQRVIRLAAGMDSVIQAAGRCNRHGESGEPVPVYVVSCLGERLNRLREIKEAKDATQTLLYMYHRAPEKFENDLASRSAIDYYYSKLYQQHKNAMGYQDYYLEKEQTTIFDLLSFNEKYCDSDAPWAGRFFLNQAFKLAGSRFKVFDNATRDIIVPYGEGGKLITELLGQECPDPAFLADWERRARSYSVSVYEWQLTALGNAVTEYAGVAILASGHYDENTGLNVRLTQNEFLEV